MLPLIRYSQDLVNGTRLISAHSRIKDEVKMRRKDRTLVAILCTALMYSTSVYCLDNADFSKKLQEDTEKILGVNEFQVYT